MKKKSKFVLFMLSIIPGLGHIYLGLIHRGIVFLTATSFVVVGTFFFGMLRIFYDPIPLIALPFIWLAALIDSMVLADKINNSAFGSQVAGVDSHQNLNTLVEELKIQNNKILTLAFSIIPGAGHMFLGQMEKGIQLMASFFLALYLSDFLNLSLLLMLAPLIWFYSFFDIFHRVSNPDKPHDKTFLGDFFRENYLSHKAGKFLGISLIVIGSIMIFDKIVMPQIEIMFDYQLREYLRTGVIAFLFIAGGIKLMLGSKENRSVEKKQDEDPGHSKKD